MTAMTQLGNRVGDSSKSYYGRRSRTAAPSSYAPFAFPPSGRRAAPLLLLLAHHHHKNKILASLEELWSSMWILPNSFCPCLGIFSICSQQPPNESSTEYSFRPDDEHDDKSSPPSSVIHRTYSDQLSIIFGRHHGIPIELRSIIFQYLFESLDNEVSEKQ